MALFLLLCIFQTIFQMISFISNEKEKVNGAVLNKIMQQGPLWDMAN